MTSNKGIVFEREVRTLFEQAGYSVMRGAGSKGEVFGMKADLVATKQTPSNTKSAILVIIQCKVKGK